MESIHERIRKRLEFLKTNTPENSDFSSLSNRADRRAAVGDFQSGPLTRERRGGGRRLESDINYKAMATGGVPYTGLVKDRKVQTVPHHLSDIDTAKDIFTNNTTTENNQIRSALNEGGIYPGNTGPNYTPVYDGAKSGKPKHVTETGIYSYDHKDIHTKYNKNREKLGWKRIKNVWHWQGIPVPDLPPDLKITLYSQLAFMDELSVDAVQRTRSQIFRAVSTSEGDTYEQSKIRAMENPESFASIDEQGRPVPESKKGMLRGPSGKPTPKVSKTLSAMRSMLSRIPVGSADMDEDLMTMSERLRIVPIEHYQIPRHLL